jgi:predicted metal-dependent hydrolase
MNIYTILCAKRNKLLAWLNLQLAKKTPECLEYVILHELLHFVEKHHNDTFIALMDKYMPYWRETRKTLNAQILDFME